ncbi:MAG: outer membrane lipoprotein-sorting protein [Proteobacteria bacterium]|nr:outer membrane lipoprotein-sorting protein [Pseudomonadota bacterium]
MMRCLRKTGSLGIMLWSMLAFFMAGSLPVAAESLRPREIMQKVDDRDDGQTSSSEMTMVLIDRRGNKRVRQMKSFRKDFGKDTKSINFFLSPADVRNTTFLSYEWDDEDKEDDNWLYLPALRKVKRISSGNKKDSFMGSDFSYADMNGLELNEWDYTFKKENVKLDGHDCWVIEAVPKKEKRKKVINETGYLKSIVWVRKDIFMTVKSKSFVKKGKKIKYFTASEIEKVQGIWTAKKLTMITTKRKRKEHATVIVFNNMIYNKGVVDSMFTTQRMERGL